MSSPKCGECGASMVLRTTTKYLNKDGSPKKFYGCSKYPECGGTHTAHQNSGKPMGIPADAKTKKWRVTAHKEFDALWKMGGYTRGDAYRLLQDIMKMTPTEAHISRFTKEDCQKLIKLLEVEHKYCACGGVKVDESDFCKDCI